MDKSFRCSLCSFETHKSFNLKKHKKLHEKLALYYSLDGFEEMKKLKVKRKLGTDGHLKKALTSHISYNSLQVGSPNRVMTLRKSKPTQSPLQN